MPDEKRKAKLSAKLKVKVLVMIATGYNARIIADYLDEEHGVTISTPCLYQHYIHNPKYKGRIKSLRNILDKNVMAHPLASKQNRLDILNKAIHECMTWRLDKINYDKDGNELSRVEKRNMQSIAYMVREARTEIEGEKPDKEIHLHFNLGRIHELATGESKLRQRSSLKTPVITEKGNDDGGNGHKNRIKII